MPQLAGRVTRIAQLTEQGGNPGVEFGQPIPEILGTAARIVLCTHSRKLTSTEQARNSPSPADCIGMPHW